MAKKKPEESKGGGSPAWMATFSDLMNLLLCFFVLLFAMSSVDAAKYEIVIASLNNSFSVITGGTDTIGNGDLVGAGVSMLSDYDIYLNEMANSTASNATQEAVQEATEVGGGSSDTENSASGDATANASSMTEEEIKEEYENMSLSETEQMAQEIEAKAKELGISSLIDVDYTADYVVIQINGALLFESGSADIQRDAYDILDKLGQIVEIYEKHIVEIEGHTDNVPISTAQFANTRVLSTFRALAVADYMIDNTDVSPKYIKYSGRGEYDPVASNKTAEGRAKNRRVEIKLYSLLNS